MYSKLPKSFLSVGSGTRSQARSKILTFHTKSGSHHVSFRNKVPLFPQSLCRWQGLLHSSLPMLWWLLPEGCIDFCWHWKDAQKIKIIKSSDNSLCGNGMLCSVPPALVASRRGVSCGEPYARVAFCRACHSIWDRGDVGTTYAIAQGWPHLSKRRLMVQESSETPSREYLHHHCEHQIHLALQVPSREDK